MSVAVSSRRIQVEGLESSFLSLRQRILKSVPELAESGPSADSARQRIRTLSSSGKTIDYNDLSVGFNQAYFFKNLYKNMLFFRALGPEIDSLADTISDIGAGAGTASVAWLTIFDHQPSSWFLIDLSAQQLLMAERILHAVSSRRFSFLCADAMKRNDLTCGTVLASYWLCEQNLSTFIKHATFATAKHIFIIDYQDVIDAVQTSLRRSHHYKVYDLRCALPPSIQSIIGESEVRATGCYATKR